jgi:hypothetical protein
MQITKNFSYSEYVDPLTGSTRIKLEVIEKDQIIRDIIGKPLYIVPGGGVRSHEYQVKYVCGGIENYYPSAHEIVCEASDKYSEPYTIKNMLKIAKIAFYDADFLRIGLYPESNVKSVHGDLWTPRPSEAWVRTKRRYIYFKTLDKAIKYVEKNYL